MRRTAAEVRDDLDACAEAGAWVKFRTGGMTPDAFPTAVELATGAHRCITRALRFKLTAGLRDPVRHRDQVTGLEHHGLLNVVLAAQCGGTVDEMTAVLSETDQATVVAAVGDVSRETMTMVRRSIHSVATCSIDGCLAGLAAVGLTPSVQDGSTGVVSAGVVSAGVVSGQVPS